MNIEERTKELLVLFDEIEADIATLEKIIREARDSVLLVKTEKDAKEFDEKFSDIEENLKHISLSN